MASGTNSSGPSVKAVFFGLDGTLLDHMLAEKRAAQVFYEKHCSILRASTLKAFAKEWETASETHIAQFLHGNVSFNEQRRRRISDVACIPSAMKERTESSPITWQHTRPTGPSYQMCEAFWQSWVAVVSAWAS